MGSRLTFARWVPVVACAAAVLLAAPAAAQGRYSWRKTHASADWDQARVIVGAAFGWPASFPSGWAPAPGWSAAYLDPIAEYCDLVVEAQGFRFRYDFDDSDLAEAGATLVEPVGSAEFLDVAIGLRFHAAAEGWRLYATTGLGFPSVDRQTVIYSDSEGTHFQDGASVGGNGLFSFNPGFVLGVGLEHSVPRRPGALAETRFVVAPGNPTEYLLAIRAGLTVPLPMR